MRSTIKTFGFFLLLTFIAYLPVTSFLFALKNDAFTGYFPPKFFMSESIHAGYLPLWNPYINYGLPQYGDMSSGFWSPVTWLVASTIGYNAYSFTIEEVFYLFMAGMGMYYLTSCWGLKNKTRLIAGIAYMCSGYMVGHLQHFNWIAGAAFLPWCLYTYLNALKNTHAINLLKLALTFSLFFSSAHPGLIIGVIYFFLFIFLASVLNKIFTGHKPVRIIKETGVTNLIILCTILLFIIGPVIGYLEVLPHISRSGKLSIASIGDGATLQSWISTILPLAVTKNDAFYATDISIRNSYFGLLFILLLLSGIFYKKTKWQHLLLIIGIFFLLLSGEAFKKFSFNYLPLIGHVRLSGEFRIFAIFSFILFSAIQLDKTYKEGVRTSLRYCFSFLMILLSIALLYSFYHIMLTKDSIFYHNIIYTDQEWRAALKQTIDCITGYDAMFFQGIVQMFILSAIYNALKKGKKTKVFYLAIMEITFACLVNIPFTGVGKASVKEVESILSLAPGGFPAPPLNPTNTNNTISDEKTKLVGHWSFYNKEIGVAGMVPYPTVLKNTVTYFQQDNTLLDTKPYLFADNTYAIPVITHYEPNEIIFSVEAPAGTTFTYKQNHYPYWTAFINNESVQIDRAFQAFLSVTTATEGKQEIEFRFKNNKMVFLIILSHSLFLLLSGILIFRTKKPEKNIQNVV